MLNNNISFEEKLERLAKKIEFEQIIELKRRGLSCESNIRGSKVFIKPGRKYVKVDIGAGSGRYMVDKNTEEIFGIKAYGKIHKGHRFGTLDEIDEWYWGGYRAVKDK